MLGLKLLTRIWLLHEFWGLELCSSQLEGKHFYPLSYLSQLHKYSSGRWLQVPCEEGECRSGGALQFLARGCCLVHKDGHRQAEVMSPATHWKEADWDSNATSFKCDLFPDHTGSMQHCPAQRCQAAASHSPRMLPYENTNSEKPDPTKPDEKVRQ
jgi:hypothetical protein